MLYRRLSFLQSLNFQSVDCRGLVHSSHCDRFKFYNTTSLETKRPVRSQRKQKQGSVQKKNNADRIVSFKILQNVGC